MLQVAEERIPLGVNVGGDVMRDLTRGVSEANPRVMRGRPDPHGTAVPVQPVGTPVAHVVAPPRIIADGLVGDADVDVVADGARRNPPSHALVQAGFAEHPKREGLLSYRSCGTQDASSNHFTRSSPSSPLLIRYATKFWTQFKNRGSPGESAIPSGS